MEFRAAGTGFKCVSILLFILLGLILYAEVEGQAIKRSGNLFFLCTSRDIRVTAYSLCSMHKRRAKRQSEDWNAWKKSNSDFSQLKNTLLGEPGRYTEGYKQDLFSNSDEVHKNNLPLFWQPSKRGGTVGDIREFCCLYGCSSEHLLGLCP